MTIPDAHGFRRQMVPLLVLSVVAWVAFLLFFRSFWPGSWAPDQSLVSFWIWLGTGTIASAFAMVGLFRAFRTPPAWRANAAVALTAPALCLDVSTTIFFERWFPAAGAGDDRIYPALIVGVVGAILLFGLFTTDPAETTRS